MSIDLLETRFSIIAQRIAALESGNMSRLETLEARFAAIGAAISAIEGIDPPPVDEGTIVIDSERHFSTLMVMDGVSLQVVGSGTIVIDSVQPADPSQHETGVLVMSGGEWLATGGSIRSDNPDGVRGHAMIMGTGYAEVRGMTFSGMGRTTVATLDPVLNPIANYAFHWHHAPGPKNLGKPYQGVFEDNHITDSPKWGIDCHRASWMLVKNNLVENCVGSGIVSEDGDEYSNFIIGNTIRGCHGNGIPADAPGRAKEDFGHEGAGIWTASPWNVIDGNIIEDCNIGTQMFLSGPNGKGRRVAVGVPKFPGASLTDPTEYTTVDLRDSNTLTRFPLVPITNTTIRRCNVAHEFWDVVGENVMVRWSTIEDCKIAFKSRFTKKPIIEDCTCTNIDKLLDHNAGYLNSLTARRISAQCNVVGFEFLEGVDSILIEDCQIDSPIGITFQHHPQHQTQFVSRGSAWNCPIVLQPKPLNWTGLVNRAEFAAFFVPYRFVFEDLGIEFYFDEQHPDYIPTAGGKNFAGSPSVGLTNRQLREQFGLCTFGHLMPDDAIVDARFPGGKVGPARPVGSKPIAKLVPGNKRIDAYTMEVHCTASIPVKPLYAMRWQAGIQWTYYPIADQPLATNIVFRASAPKGTYSFLFQDANGDLVWLPIFYGL